MDARTREIYPTLDDAVAAGVPAEHLTQIQVKTIDNGPFKGRMYERLPDGRLGKRVFSAKEAVTA